MADASFVQSSFAAGEWSQFAQGRYHDPNYRRAMNVCLNIIVLESENCVRRPGFRFAQTTRSGKPGRVIKFDFQRASPYTMEFTDGHLRFFSGAELADDNNAVGVSVSAANPAVAVLDSSRPWATGDHVYFSGLGTNSPILQNRVFSITQLDSRDFALADAVTGVNLDGATVGWVVSADARIHRVQDLVAPYATAEWLTLRSVQTEETAFLLTSGVAPYTVTVATEPTDTAFATFALNPATFNDGPYLDAFTNGVQANPVTATGIVTITLSFPLYVATTAYAKGAFVTSAGINYRSLVDQNVNHTPASSPTQWQAVSAGQAIGPNGFQGSDVGRAVRFLSEPAPWASATIYNPGDVVSYNPSGKPGAATYWSSLGGGNTNHVPGTDIVNWAVVPNTAALWTWGRIVSLSNVIAGNIAGSAHIGDMVQQAGTAAAFDGTLNKVESLCAVKEGIGGAVPNHSSVSQRSYIGQSYASTVGGGQKIAQVVAYPSIDQGFAQGQYSSGGASIHFDITLTFNLRAKHGPPITPDDGVLLGTATTLNTLAPVTITSNDQATTWEFVWVEMIASAQAGLNVTAYTLATVVSQTVFFNPSSTSSSAGINVEILGPPLRNTSPVKVWRLGVYSDAEGWPTCGAYHEGRLWLSGAVPNRIDACVSNGIVNGVVDFAPTDQFGNVLPSSAVSYVFNADQANPIFWMKSDDQGVVCGTKAGEWLIRAPTTGPITATNIAARPIPRNGSANIEPVRTENTIVFVQAFARKLMELFADVFSGKLSAPNLSKNAKHLTIGGIDEVAYQQELAPIIWTRVAGALRGCTYKRDKLTTSQEPDIFAWHRHTLGSGRTVESIAVGPSVGGDHESLTIVTNDTTTSVRHVEVMTDILDEGSSLARAWYLDDAVVPTSTTQNDAGMTLNGLWHLNGKTVTAWLGGIDCGDYVVANGSITVPYGDGVSAGTGAGQFTADFVATGVAPSGVVAFTGAMPMVVGFTYTSDGQIVRPNTPAESGARTGPAFGKKRRAQQFAAQMEGTQGVSFGTTFAKLDPAALRKPNDVKYSVLEQFTGILANQQLSDDYSVDSMVCWRTTRPYITNITAIGPYLQTQDK